MRQLILCFLFSIWVSSCVSAQEELAIGSWRAHLPYRSGQSVTQSNDAIYYATDWAIVQLDKTEMSTRFISKVDGLSNASIRLIRYNRLSDILIVIYDNSVIDLVHFNEGVPGDIITMNQLKNFNNIVGEKQVYDLHVKNDSIVYLAASYGVSKVNLFTAEFAFTTFTGIDVFNTLVFEGDIYLTTPEGIYKTEEDNVNPDDFGNWQWLGPEVGFPADYSSRVLNVFQNQLYLDINSDLYRREGEQLIPIHSEPGYQIHYLTTEGAHLLAGYRCISGCFRGRAFYLDANGEDGFIAEDCFGIPNYAVEDEQGRVWFADIYGPFRMVNNVNQESCTFREFNSPLSENNREIAIYDDQVWVASGNVDRNFSYRFLDHGFFSFIDGQWSVYNRHTRDEIKGENKENTSEGRSDDLFDFITITPHPLSGKIYAGSFYEGLIEFDGETMNLYNDKNSTLQNAIGDIQRTRISGLAFDQDNNLWVSNHSAPFPLSVYTADGNWKNFDISCSPNELHQVDIDQNGYKWIAVSNTQAGIIVFDTGNLETPGDDRCRLFTSSNSNLPNNNVNCLAVDLDGDVWVGTTEGIITFGCGSNAFDPECQGFRLIVEQDGFGAYLLDTEEIQTIAIDGANRKWIGTKNGIFVLSSSGEEEVARFTEDNSPLLDNNIIDIAINPDNGEVFIGTNKGILSYRSEAVAGKRLNDKNIIVFPNPVRPEYDGPIAIKGLARDADVKITDVSGKLVFETTALGGQAIWNARDYNGRRVNSGVYLVFSTTNARFINFENPSAAVAKILVIN